MEKIKRDGLKFKPLRASSALAIYHNWDSKKGTFSITKKQILDFIAHHSKINYMKTYPAKALPERIPACISSLP
jgi:hypothetical protein